jgi:alpha-amylase/alpha-mannosidase (GH57 family)
MTRYICVHGHFYQPPRENPWLEEIEVQDSAAPFHDWNERISLECYAPNTASRLLDGHGRIAELVNNYALINFNFGPTLLAWMARREPDTYRRILESDRVSREARSGHGNALAQAYNHMILPLASRRDKVTQVVWGIRDFQKRFGRAPEGMWLPETAVDTETLEVLAEFGIKFTVLSPRQAKRVRPLSPTGGEAAWADASDGRIDPSRVYWWSSPQGLSLDVFFYDGPISQAVAFEGLLGNGEFFVGRLMDGFSADRSHDQLVHVATDGESYGHHHRFGDMALAYALRKIQRDGHATLTNYGEYRAKHPAQWEVEVQENSSWSCYHGVERWRSDCGCRIGGRPGWDQKWRAGLRESLDRLRDSLDAFYEDRAGQWLRDPWAARDAYIDVFFERRPDTAAAFLEAQRRRELSPAETAAVWKLLEMQRQRLFMYTSCGWFFDEVSGLESVIVLQAAARALQLAREADPTAPSEDAFLADLARVPSNIPEFGHAGEVYRRLVRPYVTDLARVAAHAAVRGLFLDPPADGRVYHFSVQTLDRRTETQGAATLSVGRLRVTSDITRDSLEADFAALHLGGPDVHCVLNASPNPAGLAGLQSELFRLFREGTVADVVAALGRSFAPKVYRLQDVFLEDRRRILRTVLKDVLGRFDEVYRRVIDDNRKLLTFLSEANVPMPEPIRLAYRYVLDADVSDLLETWDGDARGIEKLATLQREAERFALPLDEDGFRDVLRRRVEGLMETLHEDPRPETARRLLDWLDFAERAGWTPGLWRTENLFYDLWGKRLKQTLDLDRADDPSVRPFLDLARRLRFRVPLPAPGGIGAA